MVNKTNEILNILAKGEMKSGFNPLAVLSGIMEGDLKEAVLGGFEFSATTAIYAKAGKIVQKSESLEFDCPIEECVEMVKEKASKLKKRLIHLQQAPTEYPYIAYFNKGFFANPSVVVVEIKPASHGSILEFTAFTTKVGLIKKHSMNVAIHKFAKVL